MEVVHGHWDSWEDDALIVDKASGRFADPDKVRRLDHVGEHFRSRGPFTVPRSPQGHPVVIQAGQSGRGRRFAARWGELDLRQLRQSRSCPQRLCRAESRDAQVSAAIPSTCSIATLIHPVCAETKSEAEDKRAADREAAARGGFADAAVGSAQLRLRLQAARRAVHRRRARQHVRHADHARPRPAAQRQDRIRPSATSSSSPAADACRHPWVGGPKEIADLVRGVVHRRRPATASSSAPPACRARYEDFVRFVVPELQRRGLFHKDYAGATLRENLGLPYAAGGRWKSAAS